MLTSALNMLFFLAIHVDAFGDCQDMVVVGRKG